MFRLDRGEIRSVTFRSLADLQGKTAKSEELRFQVVVQRCPLIPSSFVTIIKIVEGLFALS